MKKLFSLAFAVLLVTNVAFADHIGLYTDATSDNPCFPTGFTTTATVVHKFSQGATGSRFKLELPPGSSFFAFNTPYVPIGNLTSDLSLGYGQCLSGSFSLGTVVAILGTGYAHVRAADAFPSIIYTNCLFAELPATGGTATIGFCVLATESATWGKVKSLYR